MYCIGMLCFGIGFERGDLEKFENKINMWAHGSEKNVCFIENKWNVFLVFLTIYYIVASVTNLNSRIITLQNNCECIIELSLSKYNELL